jgi:CubicO group peptidase (beta-lactamase class C family)
VSTETLTDRDERTSDTPLPSDVTIDADELAAASRRPHRLRRLRRWIAWLLAALVATAVGAIVVDRTVLSGDEAARPELPRVRDGHATATVIERYRVRIPELMAEQGVPGLAVALIGANRTLWVEGFGHVAGRGSASVNADTIFSVQSMSKLFTATAVMQAVAAGRLDLDAPITVYLPEFTVHSAFEEHPERKITLRMLLSHTAGFTHEAPIGNNNELDPGTFDAHVGSISDTWLRFPVGSGYAYSNLGIDLAGYILERVEGMPFPEVVRRSLLEPLGMERSTFDRAAIRSSANRAVGHVDPYPAPPLSEPMTAAGGLYTSAADLARFLRFQLNGGSIDGRLVLEPRWLHEMRIVSWPRAGAPAGHALGVVRHRWNRWDGRPDLFDHGGGGFGFLSDTWWVPQLGIGVATLTNSQDHQLQNELSLSILTDLLSEPGVYRDRVLALPWRPPVEDADLSFHPPAGMPSLVANAAMVATGDEATRWAAYAGAYRMPAWDYLDPTGPPGRFVVHAGVPYFEAEDDPGLLIRHRLVELEHGLFLADNGETLDLREEVPTWRNLRLVRVSGGPAPWQWAILGAAALVAVTWLVAALARAVRRFADPRPSFAGRQTATRRWPRATALVASATALLTLAAVALLAWIPGLVDSGFLGGLDLSLAWRLALHLPLAVAALGASMAALAAAGWIGRWWSRAVTLQYAALAVVAVALGALLAGWNLIGWGMS